MEKTLKYLLVAVMVLVLVSSYFSLILKTEITVKEEEPEKTAVEFHGISMNVPAVDNEGNGVATKLMVESKPGRGGTLVDVDQLLFWVDTQNSIRIAKQVAKEYTGMDLSNIDLIYSVETNASVIGGPSAGAALTIATVAVLENETLDPKVIITGTINSNGGIGPVGEILAKAKAAKDVGATTFLVPDGQAVQTYYTPIEHCRRYGAMTYCTTEYKAERVDVSRDAGINVEEVSNIQEAIEYFF